MAMALSIKQVMYLVLVASSYFADDWWEVKYPFCARFCQ